MFQAIQAPVSPNPLSPSATRSFRFCVPDEWYRRSKSRNVSTASLEPSEDTIKKFRALQASTDDDYGDDEDEDDDDDEGTAKMAAGKQHSPNSSNDWRGTVSQNRLSTLFEGWLRSPPSSPNNNNKGNRNTVIHSPDKRMSIVSEPVLVENRVLRSSNS